MERSETQDGGRESEPLGGGSGAAEAVGEPAAGRGGGRPPDGRRGRGPCGRRRQRGTSVTAGCGEDPLAGSGAGTVLLVLGGHGRAVRARGPHGARRGRRHRERGEDGEHEPRSLPPSPAHTPLHRRPRPTRRQAGVDLGSVHRLLPARRTRSARAGSRRCPSGAEPTARRKSAPFCAPRARRPGDIPLRSQSRTASEVGLPLLSEAVGRGRTARAVPLLPPGKSGSTR